MSIFDPKQDAAALNGVTDHFFDRLDAFCEKWWTRLIDAEISVGGMMIKIRETPKP